MAFVVDASVKKAADMRTRYVVNIMVTVDVVENVWVNDRVLDVVVK